MRLTALLLNLLLAAGPVAAAQQELFTINLAHRPAEELLPLIRPLLGPGDAAIPGRNQLIIKASPEKIDEISALVEQLDRSPHRLLITVIQGSNLSTDVLNGGIQGAAGPGQPGGGIRGHLYQLEGKDSLGKTQQVQTLEGRPATLEVGGQIPVPAASAYGYGTGLQYQPVTTGFAVTPRLAGGEVVLDIAPWSSRISRDQGGVIDTQSMNTVVRTALGRWVEIGGQVETAAQESNTLLGHSYATRSGENRTFLKVEDLDAGGP